MKNLFVRTKEDKKEKTVIIEGQSLDPELLTEGLVEKARSENDKLVVRASLDGGMSILGNNTSYDVFPKQDLNAQSIPTDED